MQYICGGITPLAAKVFLKDEGLRLIREKIVEHLNNGSGPLLIFVAGGSASGKTTLAEIIRQEFANDAILITQDDYYFGRDFSEKKGLNFDQPQSIDLEGLKENILSLKQGKKTSVPVYSFLEDGGKRIGYKTIEPAKVIIVEGLFVLSEKLEECGGLKVFIKTNRHGRFIRRVIRDISRTCWEPNKILGYFLEIVDPMHRQYIDQQEFAADIVIANEFDPTSEPEKAGCQQEEQGKVELKEPISAKKIFMAGAEAIVHADQEDIYFSSGGTSDGELLRIRKQGGNILFTYKAPQLKSDVEVVRVKKKVEFPISSTEEDSFYAFCKEDLRILKSRDIFVLDGIIFSEDCIIISGKENRYFLEVRGDLKKMESILEKLGLQGSKVIKESYYDILKQ